MTFGRAVEKAIKEYLRQYGFKSKGYSFYKPFNDDLTLYFGYADETHFRPQYYYVKMYVRVVSVHLNEILNELAEGKIDYLQTLTLATPLNQVTTETDFIHSEFFGNRDMEENMAEFKNVFETVVLPIYEKYSCQKALFTCAIHDKQAIKWCRYVHHYMPLAYYFEGRFDEMFQYVDERLNFFKESIVDISRLSEQIDIRDAILTNLHCSEQMYILSIMRRNLQIWVEDKRAFKVDDECLPVFK